METKVFTFQIYSDGSLRLVAEGGTATTSLDELREQGWSPLHWHRLIDGPNAQYAVVMERRAKGAEGGFGYGSARPR